MTTIIDQPATSDAQAQPPRQAQSQTQSQMQSQAAADENIEAVARMERTARLKRSFAARISDAITNVAGNEWSVALHAIWFTAWLFLNTRVSPWPPFDPFPFSLLTSIVSLEAIFLTLFVLASQNRLTIEADKRAHLDLQVNLLAEQEMTLTLRMLRDLCEHFDLRQTAQSKECADLIARTDVSALARRLEQTLGPEALRDKRAAADGVAADRR
jgi:uncharacterized membrane protein